MSDQISNPLLSLIKEQNLIDDLQYEEVLAEHGRHGKQVSEILANFGIMDLEAQLQVIANHLGAEVVSLRDRELPPEVVKAIPSSTARMYRCIPVALHNSTLQVAFADPLDLGPIDEIGFVVKKDIQLVVAAPAEIEKLLDKYYADSGDNVSEILKQLGADKDIAEESAAAAGGDEAALADAANQAPIVRFVNLVLQQAVADRASDIHFEPFEDEFKIRYRVDGALY